jgi:hypothetical protein
MVPLPLLSIFVGMVLVVLDPDNVVVGWHPPFPMVDGTLVNSGCAMKMKQCEVLLIQRRICENFMSGPPFSKISSRLAHVRRRLAGVRPFRRRTMLCPPPARPHTIQPCPTHHTP